MSIKNKLKTWRKRILGEDFTMLTELYWAQIYNSTIQSSDWLINKAISPGRWAVGYNYLYVLYRVLDDMRPWHILELGLGQSTKVIGQYAMNCNLSGPVAHVVVEHDREWEEFFLKRNRDLCKKTKFLTLPLIDAEKQGEKFKAYQGFKEAIQKLNIKFNVLSIDGPLGSGIYWGRRDILPCLPECLAQDFIIIFDDFGQRKSVASTLKETEEILRQNKIEYVKGIYPGVAHKGVCVLASTTWKFLTSL